MISRRALLRLLPAAAAAAPKQRLIIDTHLEVWTDDPKFPFHHPERPKLTVADAKMPAPIENQVEVMKDFGLKYAVLINPRYFGWDNSYISHSLHKYPKLFVAHGLIDPLDPKVHERLRYWVKEHGFQGMRFSPIYHPKGTWLNSKEHYLLWQEAEKLHAVFNYYIAPHQMPMLEEMCGRFPGVKVVVDHAASRTSNSPTRGPSSRRCSR
jgi:predicted TIM-barrel fold metal-dependent hydrolase